MPALLLLFHPVHHGRALVDLADLVGAPGVVEDALGRRRLAGVDVRHDPDVAGVLECELAGHRGGVRLSGDGSGKKRALGPARATGLYGPVRVAICSRSPSCLPTPRRHARTTRHPRGESTIAEGLLVISRGARSAAQGVAFSRAIAAGVGRTPRDARRRCSRGSRRPPRRALCRGVRARARAACSSLGAQSPVERTLPAARATRWRLRSISRAPRSVRRLTNHPAVRWPLRARST